MITLTPYLLKQTNKKPPKTKGEYQRERLRDFWEDTDWNKIAAWDIFLVPVYLRVIREAV